jgi:tryptophan synthase alpha subunit
VAGLVARVRPHTGLPLLVGFGIARPEHAVQALADGADGVVIGSRAIEVAEAGGPDALREFVAGIAAGMTEALRQPNAS